MKRFGFLSWALVFGYAFLYVPIGLLILYSFNESRLVTVWGGFSTKWYAELLNNEQLVNGALLSLQIAASSATMAVILGSMVGLALTRFGRFRGRTLLGGMISAPLVMPDVITGLSLLLLFVALVAAAAVRRAGRAVGLAGWAQRHHHHHRPYHFRHGLCRGGGAVAARRF